MGWAAVGCQSFISFLHLFFCFSKYWIFSRFDKESNSTYLRPIINPSTLILENWGGVSSVMQKHSSSSLVHTNYLNWQIMMMMMWGFSKLCFIIPKFTLWIYYRKSGGETHKNSNVITSVKHIRRLKTVRFRDTHLCVCM